MSNDRAGGPVIAKAQHPMFMGCEAPFPPVEDTARGAGKKNGPSETVAHEVRRSKTSRGEQLVRRYWEEKTAMCINYKHNARFLGA